MGLGNRRFVVLGVGAICVALSLSGCSATGTTAASNASAVAIGQQAVGFTSSDSSAGGPSALQTSCPDALKQGLLAGLPATDAIATLNPTITAGVSSDPELTQGFKPSCAFGIAVSGTTVDELYFIGMSDADQSTIGVRIVNDGFVPGTLSNVSNGTQQIFTKASTRIVLAHLTIDNVKLLLVAG